MVHFLMDFLHQLAFPKSETEVALRTLEYKQFHGWDGAVGSLEHLGTHHRQNTILTDHCSHTKKIILK